MFVVAGAGHKDRVLPRRGNTSPFFMSRGNRMKKELSIFIDESGDFGDYMPHSPYYIVTLVFHEQAVNITQDINIL
jgi:hypothetical protein